MVCSLHQVDLARAYADRIVGRANGQVVMDIAAPAFDAAAFTTVYGTGAEVGAIVDGQERQSRLPFRATRNAVSWQGKSNR